MKNLVIIPAYNEEEALPKTIAGLQDLPEGFEILVVNDGSRDRTGAVAEELAQTSRIPLHVVHLPLNSGIGVAVQTGYLFTAKRGGYAYAIQFDADGQHDGSYIPALVAECDTENLDLCVGSRFLDNSGSGFRSTFTRRIGIRFFSWLISLLSGVRVTDPTSGFRCAGPQAWKRFAEHYPEDYPEPESLFWCARNKLRIGEIPVRMHVRQGGVSSIRHWRSAYYMLKVSLSIFFDRMRGLEKKLMNAELLMLVGGVIAFALTIYWVRNRELREKYAAAWVLVATLLLLCGMFPTLIMNFADANNLSYPSAVLFLALALIYTFSFAVSVSLTRQYRRNVKLTQNVALLEQRLTQLERLVQGRAEREVAERGLL